MLIVDNYRTYSLSPYFLNNLLDSIAQFSVTVVIGLTFIIIGKIVEFKFV